MNETKQNQIKDESKKLEANPVRCFTGSAIAAGLSFAAYSLMIAIATTFAKKPIHTDNQVVYNISSAVRTLVVGIIALGAGVFGIVALGLLALGIQLFLQQLAKPKT
ncbi:DUF3082 domain-containing protein [Anabaena sp. FACHB-1237]|uniref:DUF3082 domain-containing protein n=1 Tax=Anabaena sp. FACHB-1237 TaxID=2692769 RepID=UPI00168094BB|nr:DUF3082 domain-containing protein [Anabaena sp. FACHB-1237]MBD2138596.1 DUF3082 domain-containing protein [Anabaena sp. FACHB-1237]